MIYSDKKEICQKIKAVCIGSFFLIRKNYIIMQYNKNNVLRTKMFIIYILHLHTLSISRIQREIYNFSESLLTTSQRDVFLIVRSYIFSLTLLK